MTLKGYQLSFTPDVAPYWIENPQVIVTSSGTATVTRTETIGSTQIIWADYGSGQEQPHQPEDIIASSKTDDDSIPTIGEIVEVDLHLYGKRQWVSGRVAERNGYPVVRWATKKLSGEVAANRGLNWRYPNAQILTFPQNIPPEHSPRTAKPKTASGWIETRTANPKRAKPTKYKIFRWQDGKRKRSKYLSKAIAPSVEKAIATSASVSEILAIIEAGKCH